MKRRIAVLAVAVVGMTAAPAAMSGASAATTQSNNTVACVGNGAILRMSVCIPMVQL